MKPAHDRSNLGFTLIELLVTLGVIFVVLGIAIPSLMAVRNRAIVARSLSGHRQIHSIITSYGIDRDGQFPFPYTRREGEFGEPIYTVSERNIDGYSQASMRLQARIWVSLFARSNPSIVETVYQGEWSSIVGRDVPEGLVGGSYVASSTMFAVPQFFELDTSHVHEGQLRATRSSMVRYPSRKMLFEDLGSWGRVPHQSPDARSATFGFADGSADAFSQSEFTGDWVMRVMAWETGPGHTTLNGLQGIDR